MTPSAWYPAATEPMREGVYRRRWPAGPFSCWAQGQWFGDASTPDAAASAQAPSRQQAADWSGLSSPPDQPCLLCRGHGAIDFGIDADTGVDRIEACPEC